jgi:3-phosphoshikimate 1-carboxyvinyltransferase
MVIVFGSCGSGNAPAGPFIWDRPGSVTFYFGPPTNQTESFPATKHCFFRIRLLDGWIRIPYFAYTVHITDHPRVRMMTLSHSAFLCLLIASLSSSIQAFTVTRHSSSTDRSATRTLYRKHQQQQCNHPTKGCVSRGSGDYSLHRHGATTTRTGRIISGRSSTTRLAASLLTLNGDDGIETLTIPPLESVDGEIALPGSNMASQYVLLLAALSKGNTTIAGILSSDDCSQMRESLYRLGTNIRQLDNADGSSYSKKSLETPILEIAGGGLLQDLNPEASPYRLWMGQAETTLELLMAVLASVGGANAAQPQEISFSLDGMQELRLHKVESLVAHIKAMTGVSVGTTNGSVPPVTIPGVSARTVPAEVIVTSSKCLPALLIAAPLLDEDIVFQMVESAVPADLPLVMALMQLFGVGVTMTQSEGRGTSFSVDVGSRYVSPGYVIMEGDAVSASYLLAGAAITGGTVRVNGCGKRSLQPEVEFVDVLEQMGANIEWTDTSIQATRVKSKKLTGLDVDCTRIAESAVTLAVVALFASGTTTLRHLSWTADRMDHVASELRKAGAGVDTTSDTLTIYPPTKVKNYVVYETYEDHRMAMAFSLVACGGVTAIVKNPSVTAKSFPTFFKVLKMAATIQTVP